jgi:hypothetical protein
VLLADRFCYISSTDCRASLWSTRSSTPCLPMPSNAPLRAWAQRSPVRAAQVKTSVLKDGSKLESDIVLVGVGARPNVELFKGQLDLLEERPGGIKARAGLACGGGYGRESAPACSWGGAAHALAKPAQGLQELCEEACRIWQVKAAGSRW